MKRLEDVTSIPTTDKAILGEVRHALHEVLPGATVYLYGSGARGAREADSDLDLLILTDIPVSRDDENAITDAIYELELRRSVVISTIYYARAEWDAPTMRVTPFRTRIEAEAVLL